MSLWCWVLVFVAGMGLAGAKVQSFAVFVGVDEGLPGDRVLKYASRDARAVAEIFRQLGPFDQERTVLLTNPTLPEFRSTLEEVRVSVKRLRKEGIQSLVLLYYSGHGSSEGLHVRGSRFSRQEIYGLMESMESNLKIFILDACESGDFLRRKGGEILPDREIVKEDRLGSQGMIVLSSSSQGEAAQESEDYRGSVFSHHLGNGLRGMADYNSDGQVTLLEAFEYARAATRAEEIMGQTGRQNPSFDFDVVGESDPVLSSLNRKSSRIVFEGMPVASLEIFNAQSQEMERRIWLTGKAKAEYYLPAGKYLLRYPDKKGFRVGSVDLTWSRETIVLPADFQFRPETLLQRKGGAGFDLNMHGVQFGTRFEFPMEVPAFAFEYVYRTTPSKQTFGFGFAKTEHRGNATGLDVGTRAYRLGYSYMWQLASFLNGQLLIGGEASWQRLNQEIRDRRFGTSTIMAGGEPLANYREAWSNIWSAGIPFELEIFLPWRVWLSASAHGEMYRYRDAASGESRVRYRLEPALNLGHQF
jgi:hypothetical protein